MNNIRVSKRSDRAIKVLKVFEISGGVTDYAEVECGRFINGGFKTFSRTFLKIDSIRRRYRRHE